MSADFTLAELIACAEREVKIRLRVYRNRVMTHRMSKHLADREVRMMVAIAARLKELAMREAEQERLL